MDREEGNKKEVISTYKIEDAVVLVEWAASGDEHARSDGVLETHAKYRPNREGFHVVHSRHDHYAWKEREGKEKEGRKEGREDE